MAHSFVENIAKGASGDFDNKTSTENHVIKIKVPPLSVRPYLSNCKLKIENEILERVRTD